MTYRCPALRPLTLWAIVLLWFTPASADVVALLDFETQDSLTKCNAPVGTLSITNEPANVHGGTGALDLAFTAAGNVGLGFQNLTAPGAKSLSVWLKATAPTPLFYTVSETDGSAYEGFFHLPANQWTNLRVSLADLQLGPQNQDENGQLDPDQINVIYFTDLSNLGGEVGRALGKKEGPQHIWADDLALDTADVATKFPETDADGTRTTAIADFRDRVLHGLVVGDTTLTFVPGVRQTGDEVAAQLGFTIGGWQWSGMVLPVKRAAMTGLREVRLFLNTEADARLVLVLEEHDGSRYHAVLNLRGGGGWKQQVARIEDFMRDPASADENGALDLDQVRMLLVLVDAFNSVPDGEGNVRLGVDNVLLISRP